MIINKINKRYQYRSDIPNGFWLDEDENNYYIVNDNSELATKVKDSFPHFDFVLDNNNNNNLIDIAVDTAALEKVDRKIEITNRIVELKNNLRQTDYQAIKFAEGHLTEEEFSDIKNQRQLWRDEINALEIEREELNV